MLTVSLLTIAGTTTIGLAILGIIADILESGE